MTFLSTTRQHPIIVLFVPKFYGTFTHCCPHDPIPHWPRTFFLSIVNIHLIVERDRHLCRASNCLVCVVLFLNTRTVNHSLCIVKVYRITPRLSYLNSNLFIQRLLWFWKPEDHLWRRNCLTINKITLVIMVMILLTTEAAVVKRMDFTSRHHYNSQHFSTKFRLSIGEKNLYCEDHKTLRRYTWLL